MTHTHHDLCKVIWFLSGSSEIFIMVNHLNKDANDNVAYI